MKRKKTYPVFDANIIKDNQTLASAYSRVRPDDKATAETIKAHSLNLVEHYKTTGNFKILRDLPRRDILQQILRFGVTIVDVKHSAPLCAKRPRRQTKEAEQPLAYFPDPKIMDNPSLANAYLNLNPNQRSLARAIEQYSVNLVEYFKARTSFKGLSRVPAQKTLIALLTRGFDALMTEKAPRQEPHSNRVHYDPDATTRFISRHGLGSLRFDE